MGRQLFFVIAIIIFCTFVGLGQTQSVKDTSEAEGDSVKYVKRDSVTLKISDMTCGLCAAHLHNALEKVVGVIKNKVTYDEKSSGTALVQYDPTKTSLTEIIRVIENEGYEATIEKYGY